MNKRTEFLTDELFIEDIYPVKFTRKLAREKMAKGNSRRRGKRRDRHNEDYDDYSFSTD